MAVRRGQARDVPSPKPIRPATTPEGRENQLVADAFDLAQRQLRDGTASAQVISHFLKAGSTREQLEQERLARENALLEAKAEAMASAKNMDVLYVKAIAAMRSYSGQPPEELEDIDSADEDVF
jgi:hypothetical protein